MFSPSMIKPIIYLLILGAIIAAGSALHGAIKQSGYDQRVAEESEEFNKKLSSISLQHKDELEKAKHEAKHFREVAVLMQNQKPVVLTKIKERIIHDNKNCNTINGFSELLNTSLKRFDI